MSSSAPKILVVDDSRTVRTLVTQTLVKAGYETAEAADGRSCLGIVQQDVPDLAILDIQMPYLDGYGVCQEFKQMGPPYADIPIVFLTTLDSNALELLADELGAYLQKPVYPQQLLETVEELIGPAPEPATVGTDSVGAGQGDV